MCPFRHTTVATGVWSLRLTPFGSEACLAPGSLCTPCPVLPFVCGGMASSTLPSLLFGLGWGASFCTSQVAFCFRHRHPHMEITAVPQALCPVHNGLCHGVPAPSVPLLAAARSAVSQTALLQTLSFQILLLLWLRALDGTGGYVGPHVMNTLVLTRQSQFFLPQY